MSASSASAIVVIIALSQSSRESSLGPPTPQSFALKVEFLGAPLANLALHLKAIPTSPLRNLAQGEVVNNYHGEIISVLRPGIWGTFDSNSGNPLLPKQEFRAVQWSLQQVAGRNKCLLLPFRKSELKGDFPNLCLNPFLPFRCHPSRLLPVTNFSQKCVKMGVKRQTVRCSLA